MVGRYMPKASKAKEPPFLSNCPLTVLDHIRGDVMKKG
jgi:hypothetical protein